MRPCSPSRSLAGLQSLNLACNACAELPEGLTACSSLRQLSLCDNPLHISRAAAEKLAAALSQHLQQLSVSAAVALAPSGGAPAEAHCEGLKRLAELLGNRLVLQ